MSRVTRVLALALPLLMIGVFAFSGGWRVHDGRVERVSHQTQFAAPVAAQVVPTTSSPTAVQASFVHHLSPSVPWPAWAGLIVLCILPAIGSMVAWSGTRRTKEPSYAVSGGAS